ncbi:hypothetical protein [Motilibacter deserti]|uniref:Fis family transcriptional regulator n=1 Tax=Motilibacter deserti TaxID=2714956 RepID=A0ABX0GQA3_9ACTN|nr:hypothetical protein [Motilibacter deserti]NHC13024.1 hypothetical protein [Motilibacter deserti]
MRWEELFADLEAQLEEAERAEHQAEVADRTRRELARVRLVDRLRAAVGSSLTVVVGAAGRVRGRLVDVGPDWLLLQEDGRDALVPVSAVTTVLGLGGRAAGPPRPASVAARLTLGTALRGLVRDRATVRVTTVDGADWTGTLDRVGADFVDSSEGPVDEGRDARARGVRSVPFAALAVIRAR